MPSRHAFRHLRGSNLDPRKKAENDYLSGSSSDLSDSGSIQKEDNKEVGLSDGLVVESKSRQSGIAKKSFGSFSYTFEQSTEADLLLTDDTLMWDLIEQNSKSMFSMEKENQDIYKSRFGDLGTANKREGDGRKIFKEASFDIGDKKPDLKKADGFDVGGKKGEKVFDVGEEIQIGDDETVFDVKSAAEIPKPKKIQEKEPPDKKGDPIPDRKSDEDGNHSESDVILRGRVYGTDRCGRKMKFRKNTTITNRTSGKDVEVSSDNSNKSTERSHRGNHQVRELIKDASRNSHRISHSTSDKDESSFFDEYGNQKQHGGRGKHRDQGGRQKLPPRKKDLIRIHDSSYPSDEESGEEDGIRSRELGMSKGSKESRNSNRSTKLNKDKLAMLQYLERLKEKEKELSDVDLMQYAKKLKQIDEDSSSDGGGIFKGFPEEKFREEEVAEEVSIEGQIPTRVRDYLLSKNSPSKNSMHQRGNAKKYLYHTEGKGYEYDNHMRDTSVAGSTNTSASSSASSRSNSGLFKHKRIHPIDFTNMAIGKDGHVGEDGHFGKDGQIVNNTKAFPHSAMRSAFQEKDDEGYYDEGGRWKNKKKTLTEYGFDEIKNRITSSRVYIIKDRISSRSNVLC